MSQVQSYDGLVVYFHRKGYATKTNVVGRRTQSNALTLASLFRVNLDERLVLSVTLRYKESF